MQALLWVLAVYGSVGLLVGSAFVWRGVARVDPAARSGTVGFRALILPGAAALWPWVVLRWWRGAGGGRR